MGPEEKPSEREEEQEEHQHQQEPEEHQQEPVEPQQKQTQFFLMNKPSFVALLDNVMIQSRLDWVLTYLTM